AVTSDALPYGAELTLTEQAPAAVEGGTWTGHEFSTDSVTIGDGTTVEVTLTNTIDADEPADAGAEEEGTDDDGKGGDGKDMPRTGASVIGALLAGTVLLALGVLLSARTMRRKRA